MLEWFLSLLPPMTTDQAASAQGYAAIVQAGLALLLTFITAWALRVSWVASRTTRHQRYDALMPLIELVLATEDLKEHNSVGRVTVTLKNVGSGPALKVWPELIPCSRTAEHQARSPHPYIRDVGYAPAVVPVLVAVGNLVMMSWLEPRHAEVQNIERAERDAGNADPSQAKGWEHYARNREAALRQIADDVLPLTFHVSWEDVFGRKFIATVSASARPDPDPYGRLGGIRLGEPKYTLPKR